MSHNYFRVFCRISFKWNRHKLLNRVEIIGFLSAYFLVKFCKCFVCFRAHACGTTACLLCFQARHNWIHTLSSGEDLTTELSLVLFLCICETWVLESRRNKFGIQCLWFKERKINYPIIVIIKMVFRSHQGANEEEIF